jgi:hypothetical protein
MLRLSTVFLIWIASTACAPQQGDAGCDAVLHLLLDRYERSYYSAADADRGQDSFSRHPSKHER